MKLRRWNRLKVYNRYYTMSGFYKFLFKIVGKFLGLVAALVLVFFLVEKYLIDLESFYDWLLNDLPPIYVFIVFFISESIMGMIPPDLFIAWTNVFDHPFQVVGLLAVLSYAGGVVAYFLGKSLRLVPSLNRFAEKKYEQYKVQITKWGGFFIIASALFPLPFAMISTVAGMVHYPINYFLLFGSTRILRFFLYAVPILNVLS